MKSFVFFRKGGVVASKSLFPRAADGVNYSDSTAPRRSGAVGAVHSAKWRRADMGAMDTQGRGVPCFHLGPPVVRFYPFLGESSPNRLDYRKKGTLIPTSLLEDLVTVLPHGLPHCSRQSRCRPVDPSNLQASSHSQNERLCLLHRETRTKPPILGFYLFYPSPHKN